MHNEFDILLNKLNAFIRKYYYNKLIRGLLISLTGILFLVLFIDFIEYFAWMGKAGRRFVFFTFLVVTFLVVVYQIVIPVLKLFRIGKTLSYEEAAKIIGRFFPEVSDKLLNVIQLKSDESRFSKQEMELLLASINQKSHQLKPVPFVNAVDFRKNLKYLKYFLLPFFVVLVFLIVYPSFIIEPSKRIVNFQEHFSKPLPYSIELLNDSLSVLQHDDYKIKVKVTGDELPSEVAIVGNGLKYVMYQENKGIYEYIFKDVDKDVIFKIVTDDYTSDDYHLKVLPKPVIYSFDIKLTYPEYLHKKQDDLSGLGDIVVPEYTSIEWRIHTKDVSGVVFLLDDSVSNAKKINENTFLIKASASKGFRYGLSAFNTFVISPDTLFYSVQVIKDEYPVISVDEYSNKQFPGFVQFNGKISDDNGFHSLKFYYKEDADDKKWKVKNIKIDKQVSEQYFNYSIQLFNMNLDLGNGLNYYFEVRDNDAIHHYKASRSTIGYVYLPDEKEMEKMKDSTSDLLKDELKNKVKELEEINKSLDELKMEMFNKKNLNWSDKKKIEELLQKEDDLQKKIEEINKLNEEIRQLEETLKQKTDPSLQQQLDELQKMFDELKDKNLEKELKKLQEELNKMDKEKLSEFLDKMKKKNESLKDNLEQNLELYKQFEVEKKMDEVIDQLKELANKQKELSKNTKSKKIQTGEAIKQQEKIKKEFNNIEKQIDELKKLDSELKDPFNIKKDNQAIDDINKEMESAKDKLQDNKREKASENQKNAGEKMDKMADEMESMMEMSMRQRLGEDIEQVRRLLDNLVDLSFRQENMIKYIHNLSSKDPKFVTSTEELSNLKDEFKIIKDSLRAIGKRQIAVKSFIIKETESIQSNLESAIKYMADRNKGASLTKQQYSMTHINNLALMLEESLNRMKSSMSSSSKGSKACPNPGGGKGKSLDEIMKEQQSLSKKMQQKRGQQSGKKPGNKNKNKGGKDNGEWGSSEELARMAAMQYEIRMQLQKYMEQLKGQGLQDGNLNQALEDMKKNEEDIINRNITRETINRQKDIEVRLLKSKKAKIQREKEKKREAQEGKNNPNRIVEGKEFEIEKMNKKDIIFTNPVELKYYYNVLYKKYIYKIELNNR